MDNNNMYNEGNGEQQGTFSGMNQEPNPMPEQGNVQGQNYGYTNGNPGYQYTSQGGYQQELEEPMSMGEWIITLLLTLIPCVNIVLLFVWGFSSTEKKSKSNYCKAQLIVIVVGFVINMVLFTMFGASILASLSSF